MNTTEPSHPSRVDWTWRSGVALLAVGVSLLLLAGLDRTTGLPFRMPGFWFVNRPFWPFLGLIAVVAGMRIINRGARARWEPAEPGRRFNSLVFYTRKNCGLCDEARDVLDAHSRFLPSPVDVDVDDDPELVEKYGKCVPVVEIDGKVRFRGRVDVSLLRRLIAGTRPNS